MRWTSENAEGWAEKVLEMVRERPDRSTACVGPLLKQTNSSASLCAAPVSARRRRLQVSATHSRRMVVATCARQIEEVKIADGCRLSRAAHAALFAMAVEDL